MENRKYYKYVDCVEVFEDDYEEGESVRMCNWWNKTEKDYDKEELIEKLCSELFTTKDEFFKLANFEDNYIQFSVLVDKDNYKPTNKQIENWKIGKEKLYSQNHFIKFYEVEEKEINLK
jgi:hypothetical protein